MVGETEPENPREDIERPDVLRRKEYKRDVEERKEEKRVEGVTLGDDGL